MSYQVFARKWRPRKFDDLVGHTTLRQALTHALDTQQLHHAYLFTGTRGIGKTTLARLLAKSLLCRVKISAQPCLECAVCQSIDEGQCIDLIEVDAASRTKVEETRDLLDNVQYMPAYARFKIYLIDEVHMLSTHSFNALLKTLEEPPPHAKFILATTDPNKLPATIISRCLHFPLRPLSPELIKSQLAYILTTEKIEHEPVALDLLAESAQGSLRDGLSLLEQAVACGAGQVKIEQVRQMLGSSSKSSVLQLLTAVSRQQGAELLQITSQLATQGVDFAELTKMCLQLLHQLTISPWLSLESLPQDPQYQALHSTLEPQVLQLYYQIALEGGRDLQWAPDPQSGFEMILLRMMAFDRLHIDGERRTSPLKVPDAQLTPGPSEATPVEPTQAPAAPAPTASTTNDAPPALAEQKALAASDEPKNTTLPAQSADVLDWHPLLQALRLDPMARQLAKHCALVAWRPPRLELALSRDQSPLMSEHIKERLSQALKLELKQEVKLVIELVDALNEATPARVETEQQAEAYQAAMAASQADPFVKVMMEKFDAKIEKLTLKPSPSPDE